MTDSKEENDNNLFFREITLYKYMKKGPLSDVEGMLHIIEIFNHLEMQKSLSSEKYLNINLNSSNISINRFLDLKINFVLYILKLEQKPGSKLLSSRTIQFSILLRC